MPREDVPYPGRAVCSLNERIAELEDAVDEKLKSINGIRGDGAGNINVLSDSPQLTVTADPSIYGVRLTVDLDGTDGLVTTDTAQTVTGTKTFTAPVTATGGVIGNLIGNAATASVAGQLETDAGSATNPVYFSGGQPIAGTYTLADACARGVDNAPASGSSNLVTSDGIHTAITPVMFQAFSANWGTSTGHVVYGTINYTRIAPKHGILAGSIQIATVPGNDRYDYLPLSDINSVLGLTLTPYELDRAQGWWLIADASASGSYGQYATIRSGPYLTFGRYYNTNGDMGDWPSNILTHTIVFGDVLVKEA